MGRIKTKQVKRITNELMDRHGDRITVLFEDNKKVVAEYLDSESKKLRNMIAGYAARRKKKLLATQ